MKKALSKIRWVVDNSSLLGFLALLGMMMVTVFDVSLRFFGYPIMGSMEITVALMVCIVYFGMGRCTLEDAHLKVELFKKFPFLDKINSVITMVLCLIIGWQNIISGNKALIMQSASQLLRIPKYPFLYITAFGFFLVAIAIAINLLSSSEKVETIE